MSPEKSNIGVQLQEVFDTVRDNLKPSIDSLDPEKREAFAPEKGLYDCFIATEGTLASICPGINLLTQEKTAREILSKAVKCLDKLLEECDENPLGQLFVDTVKKQRKYLLQECQDLLGENTHVQ